MRSIKFIIIDTSFLNFLIFRMIFQKDLGSSQYKFRKCVHICCACYYIKTEKKHITEISVMCLKLLIYCLMSVSPMRTFLCDYLSALYSGISSSSLPVAVYARFVRSLSCSSSAPEPAVIETRQPRS